MPGMWSTLTPPPLAPVAAVAVAVQQSGGASLAHSDGDHRRTGSDGGPVCPGQERPQGSHKTLTASRLSGDASAQLPTVAQVKSAAAHT